MCVCVHHFGCDETEALAVMLYVTNTVTIYFFSVFSENSTPLFLSQILLKTMLAKVEKFFTSSVLAI